MEANENLDMLARLQVAVSIPGHPLPTDVQAWLRDGLQRYAYGGRLDAALGLRCKPGFATQHPGTLLRRAALETGVATTASVIPDKRIGARAAMLEQVFKGCLGDAPAIVIDYAKRTQRYFGDEIPTARWPLTRILTGDTMAARCGLVRIERDPTQWVYLSNIPSVFGQRADRGMIRP